jgi:hypothetical protein
MLRSDLQKLRRTRTGRRKEEDCAVQPSEEHPDALVAEEEGPDSLGASEHDLGCESRDPEPAGGVDLGPFEDEDDEERVWEHLGNLLDCIDKLEFTFSILTGKRAADVHSELCEIASRRYPGLSREQALRALGERLHEERRSIEEMIEVSNHWEIEADLARSDLPTDADERGWTHD